VSDSEQILKRGQLQNVGSAQLPADDGLALIIDGMDLEHVLGQIEADNDNLGTWDDSSRRGFRQPHLTHHIGAGAVHPITSALSTCFYEEGC
jgi:hypothetical protein